MNKYSYIDVQKRKKSFVSELSHKPAESRGFALLFVILIIGAVVTATAGITTFIQKETFLSSTATDSQAALYAADTGIECGLYFQRQAPGGGFLCMRNTAAVDEGVGGTLRYPFDYEYAQVGGNSIGVCGFVTINPNASWIENSTTVAGVEMQSFGYNACTRSGVDHNPSVARPDYDNPLLLERKLVIRYVP